LTWCKWPPAPPARCRMPKQACLRPAWRASSVRLATPPHIWRRLRKPWRVPPRAWPSWPPPSSPGGPEMADQYLSHVTREGERWDQLAFTYYGDATRYEPIVRANPQVPLTGA